MGNKSRNRKVEDNEPVQRLKNIVNEHVETITKLYAQIDKIERLSRVIIDAFQHNNKLIIFGNGGSAADAQHIAAEFVNKFKRERKPLPAIALTTDSSIMSSISNDSSFSYVFERQIRALGNKGDVALAITTSDITDEENTHSSNLAFALKAAKEKEMITIGLIGEKSKKILGLLDYYVAVPSKQTPRIQEAHIMIAHMICEVVEEELSAL